MPVIIYLMISFISSFTFTFTPFLLIFLSNLFIAFEVKLLTNPSKLSIAKGIARFVITFFT